MWAQIKSIIGLILYEFYVHPIVILSLNVDKEINKKLEEGKKEERYREKHLYFLLLLFDNLTS